MAGGTKKFREISLPVLQGDDSRAKLHSLYDQWFNCQKCPELASNRGGEDIVFGDGNPDADVVIVGEAPGETENQTLIPFTGESGKLLNQILGNVSDDAQVQEALVAFSKERAKRERDRLSALFHEAVLQWRQREFFVTNTICCWPPQNRRPSNPEIANCWERLWATIYTVDPILIVAMGETALSTLVGKTMKITGSRGKLFDVEFPGRAGPVVYPVLATFHPAYLLRRADWNVRGGDYDKTVEDFRSAMAIIDSYREKNFGIPTPVRLKGI